MVGAGRSSVYLIVTITFITFRVGVGLWNSIPSSTRNGYSFVFEKNTKNSLLSML